MKSGSCGKEETVGSGRGEGEEEKRLGRPKARTRGEEGHANCLPPPHNVQIPSDTMGLSCTRLCCSCASGGALPRYHIFSSSSTCGMVYVCCVLCVCVCVCVICTIYEVDPYAAMRWRVYSAQFAVASLRL